MIMRILLVAVVLALLVDLCIPTGIRRRSISKDEDLELDQQPKILNKPYIIKTIHMTKSGDICDCIDIYRQPSLSHPLLKNHKIQLKPNFAVEETTHDESGRPSYNNIARTKLEIMGEVALRDMSPSVGCKRMS